MVDNSPMKAGTRSGSFVTSKGFTLVELVVGMVVLSIALVMLTSMLFPQADRAAETLHRVRSAELAHSVMNEIWGKRYDQNTNPNGGVPACTAAARPDLGLPAGVLTCTIPDNLGPDTGENRNSYNDVDDYHGLSENSNMLNSASTYKSQYLNYKLLVTITYPNANTNSKLITVTVTTPSGEPIVYNAVRSNY